MKKYLILAVMAVMFMVPVIASANLWDEMVANGSASVAYAYSFSTENSLEIAKVSTEVGSLTIKDMKLPINLDLLGALNSGDDSKVLFGIGASIDILKANKISLGAGYLPQEKWIGYIAWKIIGN